MNKRCNEASFRLSQLCAVTSIDSDVAERSGAIVLYINIRRCEQLNKNRNGSSVDKLLSVIIYKAYQ